MRSIVAVLLLLCSSTQVASAQSTGLAAVGLSASSKMGVKDGTAGHVSPGFLVRYGHGRDGFGPEFGLGWYSAQLAQPVGSVTAAFGELHVRPVLAGYGYTLRLPKPPRPRPDTRGIPGGAAAETPRRRVAITARVLGGYALTRFELTPTFDDAYRRTFSATSVSTRASNALVVRPDLSAWVDISRKIGLYIGASYTLARPHVAVTSSAGRDERRIHADVVTFTMGTVYSVF